jgi:hypothetical protein
LFKPHHRGNTISGRAATRETTLTGPDRTSPRWCRCCSWPVQQDLRPGLANPARPAYADGLRLLATAWTEAYQARFEGPALESGADQRTAMELAAQLGGDFRSTMGRALGYK